MEEIKSLKVSMGLRREGLKREGLEGEGGIGNKCGGREAWIVGVRVYVGVWMSGCSAGPLPGV